MKAGGGGSESMYSLENRIGIELKSMCIAQFVKASSLKKILTDNF